MPSWDRAWVTVTAALEGHAGSSEPVYRMARSMVASLPEASGRAQPLASWGRRPLAELANVPAAASPADVLTPPAGDRVRLGTTVLRTGDLLGRVAVELAAAEAQPRSDLLVLAVRTLAQLAAGCWPGRSVELRVPPATAVQCGIPGEGQVHTRGTPPNVVETDPETFLRLGVGQLSWADAVADARVTASGNRSDVGWMLPITTPAAGSTAPTR